jgi:peptide/nickel transport system permease protein
VSIHELSEEQGSSPVQAPAKPPPKPHPIRNMVARRSLWGIVSIVVVSIIVYFATLILPGDAATAILGQQATPARLASLRHELHLDQPALVGFWHWASGAIHGDFGNSLTQGSSVWSVVGPRLANSLVLIVVASVLSTVLGILLGALAAARRDTLTDHGMSVTALVANAMPEFVVGVFVILIFSVKVFHWFPALSILPPGTYIWEEPSELVLPVLTLVIVCTPYVFRMVRASTIEALNSDYAEVAELKGASPRRLLFAHAVPNALAPTIQVIGLNLLYLAGGIVLVETVFNYQGVGFLLISSINDRDVPVIQFLVVLLAIFYVILNIITDVAVLLVTPRRRLPR